MDIWDKPCNGFCESCDIYDCGMKAMYDDEEGEEG